MIAAQEHGAPSISFGAMPMSVSVPEGLNWHMILDYELSQLTRPESGVIGSVGFVALGAFLGLIPAALSALEKMPQAGAVPANAFSMGDLSSVVVCGGSLVTAILCLIIFGLYHYRNRGLASKIRTRSKRDFRFTGEAGRPAS
jgi:hypothetical protein